MTSYSMSMQKIHALLPVVKPKGTFLYRAQSLFGGAWGRGGLDVPNLGERRAHAEQ